MSEWTEHLQENFTLEAWAEYLKGSSDRALNIIGFYVENRRPDIRSYDQAQVFLKRNIKPARELSVFTNDQLESAVEKIIRRDYITDWGLETILKYVFHV